MCVNSFVRRAEDLKIAKELDRIRNARNAGVNGYSVSKAREILHKTIESAEK